MHINEALASLWALDTQWRPNAHNRCPRVADLSIRFVNMVFWFFCTDAVQFIWIFWAKQYPIWSVRILFSYSIIPFSKGPYFWENMYKIGKFLIWLVGYFPDQKFYWGKGISYRENRLFLGPCIDNLGSVVIIRGGGILYYTTGKFTQKLNCTNAKTTVKKESKTSPSCSLKSTPKQQKIEFKMESVVTYATYELISVFCFHFVYTIISLSHSEYDGTAVFKSCNRKPDFGHSDQVKFKPHCSSMS